MSIKMKLMAAALLMASTLPAMAFELDDSGTHMLDRPTALDAKYSWPDAFVKATVEDKDSISRAYLIAGGAEEDFSQKSSPWRQFLNQVVRANPDSFPASPRRERDFMLREGDTIFVPAIGRFALALQGQSLVPPSVEQRLAIAETNLAGFATASSAWKADLAEAKADAEEAKTLAGQAIAGVDSLAGRFGTVEELTTQNKAAISEQNAALETAAVERETIRNDLKNRVTTKTFSAAFAENGQVAGMIATAMSGLEFPETVTDEHIRSVAQTVLDNQPESAELTMTQVIEALTAEDGLITQVRGEIDVALNGDGTAENPGLLAMVQDLQDAVPEQQFSIVDGHIALKLVGDLTLSDEQKKAGWEERNGWAVAPRGVTNAEVKALVTTASERAASKSWVWTALGLAMIVSTLILGLFVWLTRRSGGETLSQAKSANTTAGEAKAIADEAKTTINGDGTDANPGLVNVVTTQGERLDEVEANLRFDFRGLEEFAAELRAAHFDTLVDGTIVLDAGTSAEQRFAVQAQKPRKDVVTFISGVKDLTTEIPLSSVVSAIKKAAKHGRLDKSLSIAAVA